MDESVEQEEEVIIENIEPEADQKKTDGEEKKPDGEEKKTDGEDEKDSGPQVVPSISNIDNEPVLTKLKFNDFDSVLDASTGNVSDVSAPKTIERLEEISTSRAIQRKLEEEDDEDDYDDRIKIHTGSIDLDEMDIFDMNKPTQKNEPVVLDGIEELA